MSVVYSTVEDGIFKHQIIAFRAAIYACSNTSQMLIAATNFAANLKVAEPSIHPSRSENAILIHLIYFDNLLEGVQTRHAQKDSSSIGTKSRVAGQPTGPNPLTTKFRHYLL